LLAGAIDFAGLFPPAALPFDPAIRNYVRYRDDRDAWLLGRFICPTARFAELEPYRDQFSPDRPLELSALGQGGADAEAFQSAAETDFRAIQELRERWGGRVRVGVYEVKPPVGAAIPAEPTLSAFAEVSLAGDWRANVGSALAAGPRLKLRCGGLDAAAFPTCEQVAFVLVSAARAGAGIKFTAGLHHPVRRFDPGVKTRMHGFLNVYTAGLLARDGADEDLLIAALEDEDPASFTAGENFRWRDRAWSAELIRAARATLTSFGSCSFDEPREDLRAMGLL
jgi:hypothetical protein